MRGTQKEQIMAASFAYIMVLNYGKGMTDRYCVYLQPKNGGEIDILWPSDSHNGAKSQELLDGQVYSKNRSFPAYHFALNGCGYSKPYEIKLALCRINPAIEVRTINGHSPSSSL